MRGNLGSAAAERNPQSKNPGRRVLYLTRDTLTFGQERADEGQDRLVQALKLWAEGPPCEGHTGTEIRRRGRTGAGRGGGVRHRCRRSAEVFEERVRPLSDRRGSRGDRERL